MSKIIVAPSILSADFSNLENDIRKVESAGADWIHVDVMDGHFVPNITIGAPVVKSLRKITTLPFDVHLMIEKPEEFINSFVQSGADIITVHYEACENIENTVNLIKSTGIKVGVSIKPNTSVNLLENILKDIDLVLIMTVEPGFGGQEFIESCVPKIKQLKQFVDNQNLTDFIIEVDGGINDKTAKIVIDAGANALVAGSFIYKSNDISCAIESLRI